MFGPGGRRLPACAGKKSLNKGKVKNKIVKSTAECGRIRRNSTGFVQIRGKAREQQNFQLLTESPKEGILSVDFEEDGKDATRFAHSGAVRRRFKKASRNR